MNTSKAVNFETGKAAEGCALLHEHQLCELNLAHEKKSASPASKDEGQCRLDITNISQCEYWQRGCGLRTIVRHESAEERPKGLSKFELCCTGDEGMPLGAAMQVETPNHLEQPPGLLPVSA